MSCVQTHFFGGGVGCGCDRAIGYRRLLGRHGGFGRWQTRRTLAGCLCKTIAAAAKLDEFLRLMDREQLDAATSQVVAFQPPAEPVAETTMVEEASSEPVVAEAGEAGGAPSFSDGYGQ